MTMRYGPICPFHISDAELCRAAISSSMIDMHYCFGGDFAHCAIFIVIQSKNGGDQNVSEF